MHLRIAGRRSDPPSLEFASPSAAHVQIRPDRTSRSRPLSCVFLGAPTSNTDKMGCGMSSEDKEGKQRNEEIDNQLKRDKMNLRSEIKMLLLGEASRCCCACRSSTMCLAANLLRQNGGADRGRRSLLGRFVDLQARVNLASRQS